MQEKIATIILKKLVKSTHIIIVEASGTLWYNLARMTASCGGNSAERLATSGSKLRRYMREQLVEFFSRFLSPHMVTFVVAMLPVSELRGALPYALTIGKLPLIQAFPIAVLGNMVPIPIFMYLLEPGSRLLSRFRHGKRFVDWLFARTRARSEKIRKYELIGLALFVAIPLPITGAWTGTIASYLFGLRKGRSLVAITCGVCIAGVVVSVATIGVREVVALILGWFRA